MNRIKKYGLSWMPLLFFTITVIVCLGLELLVAMIPQTFVQENMEKTAMFYYAKQGRENLMRDVHSTTLDYYADTILLNVVYGMGESSPWNAVLTGMYFDDEKNDANVDLMEIVFQNREPNTQYGRYWHGSMIWIRPLLCIMSVKEMYRLYTVLIVLGVLAIGGWTLKNKKYKLLISFLGAFTLSGGWVTPFCLEYGNIMLLLLVMIPLFFMCDRKGEGYLFNISVVCGALTCFIDFLTVELLTITIPLLFLLLWNEDKDKGRVQKKKYIIACMLWGMSYVGMFLMKWFLVVQHLGYEVIKENFSRTKDHMHGSPGIAVMRNIGTLIFGERYDSMDVRLFVVLVLTVTIVGILMWRIKIEKENKLVMMLLALLPYARYACISSHSATHYFFTYRAQMVTVMWILFLILNIREKNKGIK